MQFDDLIEKMSPEIHASLKRALEIGKWPDGKLLSAEQRELCMEAVIAYDMRHLNEEQRVGFIDRGSKAEGEMCDDDSTANNPDRTDPLKWQ